MSDVDFVVLIEPPDKDSSLFPIIGVIAVGGFIAFICFVIYIFTR